MKLSTLITAAIAVVAVQALPFVHQNALDEIHARSGSQVDLGITLQLLKRDSYSNSAPHVDSVFVTRDTSDHLGIANKQINELVKRFSFSEIFDVFRGGSLLKNPKLAQDGSDALPKNGWMSNWVPQKWLPKGWRGKPPVKPTPPGTPRGLDSAGNSGRFFSARSSGRSSSIGSSGRQSFGEDSGSFRSGRQSFGEDSGSFRSGRQSFGEDSGRLSSPGNSGRLTPSGNWHGGVFKPSKDGKGLEYNAAQHAANKKASKDPGGLKDPRIPDAKFAFHDGKWYAGGHGGRIVPLREGEFFRDSRTGQKVTEETMTPKEREEFILHLPTSHGFRHVPKEEEKKLGDIYQKLQH